VEARSRGRVGKTSKRSTLREDRLDGHRVTPARRVRTLRMLEPLKPRSDLCSSWPMTEPIAIERHEGQVASRGAPATAEGNPLKAESPRALPA
jgi:hypothetical protein